MVKAVAAEKQREKEPYSFSTGVLLRDTRENKVMGAARQVAP